MAENLDILPRPAGARKVVNPAVMGRERQGNKLPYAWGSITASSPFGLSSSQGEVSME